jgi:hypothetical protein
MDHRDVSRHKVREGEPPGRCVADYRVSTGQQGRFANPGVIIAEFPEVMSGRKDARPELAKALSLCRVARAALVIGRLDWLRVWLSKIFDISRR